MLLFLAIGSVMGAMALCFFATLPPLMAIAIPLMGALFTIVSIFVFTNKPLLKNTAVLLLGVFLGLSWAYTQASNRLRWRLPRSDINQEISIQGKVVGVPQADERGQRLDVALTHYRQQPLSYFPKVRLYWQRREPHFKEGDMLVALIKVKPAWRLANPGGFDQEKQFFLEGIRAQGTLVSLEHYQPANHTSLNQWRQQINEKMALLLGDKPFLGVIQATTLGLNQNITPAQWQVFQITGTTHAIAISGLHISLVAMLCFHVVSWSVRRVFFLTLVMPAKKYAAIAAIAGAVVYSALAGFSVPTQRSLVMVVVAMLAILLGRPILTWHGLALAGMGILIVDPLAPLQMGFWLSFGCVGALIYAESHGLNKWRVYQWVLPQCIVFIGMLPVGVLFFKQIALLSPLANMMVLPIMNVIVIPASLVSILLMGMSASLAKWGLSMANAALEVIWAVLEKIAHSSWSVWHGGHGSTGYFLLAFLGGVILLAPKGMPAKGMGWLTFLPLLFHLPARINHGECRFTLLDVGQGLAAVIQTQHHTLLFDAGPMYGLQANAGQRVIKPFFHHQKITHLDKVIISHSDLDHRGGLVGLHDWPIREILTSEPDRLKMPSRPCLAGEAWEWDGVSFRILNPSQASKKRNDRSCVLKVATANHGILLTGDIEQAAEKKLLQQFPDDLPSTILVVPHHGSLTSSTPQFIEKVAPRYALFPVGHANQYGFPKLSVLNRYQAFGSTNLLVWRTGAISFYLTSGELLPPQQWRLVERRYWHESVPEA